MKLHLLGTGTSQGVPVLTCDCETCKSTDPRDQRLRSCAVLEVDGKKVLIDTGPDIRQQLLRARIDNIDAIIYTHEHNDHVIGLDEIRPYNFKQKVDMPLYGLPRVMQDVKDRFSYIFAKDRYPGAPMAVARAISDIDVVEVAGLKLRPIDIRHGRLPILGYRYEDMAFITDASEIPSRSMDLLRGLKVLVVNALRLQQHPTHFNLDEALEVIEELAPDRAYITHVSHLMGPFREWTKRLPPNVFGAYDGLVIEV